MKNPYEWACETMHVDKQHLEHVKDISRGVWAQEYEQGCTETFWTVKIEF